MMVLERGITKLSRKGRPQVRKARPRCDNIGSHPRLFASQDTWFWGRNDPYFRPPGAEAYKRDITDAQVHFLDHGHFALETHQQEIDALMRDFLSRKLKAA